MLSSKQLANPRGPFLPLPLALLGVIIIVTSNQPMPTTKSQMPASTERQHKPCIRPLGIFIRLLVPVIFWLVVALFVVLGMRP